jgi:hypothetical protein
MARASHKRSWFSSVFSVDRLFGYREQARKTRRKRSTRLRVERLEDRTVPDIGFSNGVLSITNDKTVDLRANPTFPSLFLDVFENKGRVTDSTATPDAFILLPAIDKINVTTVGDNAELFLDFTNGNFIPTNGISYDGGSGGNTGLDMFGPADPFTNETETPFGPTSGQIVFDNNAPIAYSNTTFINDTVPITGTATDQGTAFTDALNVVDGPQLTIAGTTFQTTQLNSTNRGEVVPQDTFATINFAQKPTVVIDGLGGNDTYTVSNPATTTTNNGLVTLTTGQATDVGDQQVFHVLTPFDHTITYNVVGGIGNNTLVGPDLTNIWEITGTNSGSLGVGIIPAGTVNSFTHIQNLTGGLGDDVFFFQAGGSLTGSIDGGGQGPNGNTIIGDNFGDTFNINGTNAGNIPNLVPAFSNIQNLQGGGGNDSFTFIGSGALTGAIDGGLGTNTITGNDAGDNFVINGANTGTIAGLLGTKGFSDFQNLVGGRLDDTFTFFGTGKLSGTINGGNAGSNGNTIVGPDTLTVFNITGANAGNVSTVLTAGFTNVQNLTGGLADDFFDFSAGGSLKGTIDGGGQGPVGNEIVGADNGAIFTVTGTNAGTISDEVGAFVNVQNLLGGSGPDTFVFSGSGALTGGISGGAGNNLIFGNDSGDNFIINGPDSGTIAGLLGTKGFANIGSLHGGLADDTFTFFGAGQLSGTINGGNAGPNGNTIVGNDLGDTFSITGANAGTLLDAVNGALLGVGGFTNVQNLTGGLADDIFTFAGGGGSLSGKIDGGAQGPNGNIIIGDDTGRTYTITDTNAGTISTLLPGGFSNVQNLRGGKASDTFQFSGAGALTGGIDGGPGGNLIIGNDNDDSFLINGSDSGTISGLLGTHGFVSIGSLQGGLANDTFTFFGGGKLSGTIDGGNAGPAGNTIVGNDNGDSFSITGANAGNVSDVPNGTLIAGGFTHIQNLTGGVKDDTFTFTAAGNLDGTINGGGFAVNGNTIVGDNGDDLFTITGLNAGSITNAAGITVFVNIQNLNGGGGNDTFKFLPGGALTGTINGGAGNNQIITGDLGDTFVINGPDSGFFIRPDGTTAVFVNVGNLVGGLGDDTFIFVGPGTLSGSIDGGNAGPKGNTIVGNDNGDSFTITGTNAGTLSDAVNGALLGPGGFTNIQNLTGGSNDDLFTFVAPGKLTGKIDGGDESALGNTIVGDDNGDKFTIKGTNKGSIAGILASGFSNVENLQGGAGDDTFTFSGSGLLGGFIDGGDGNNTIVGNNSGDHFFINGGFDESGTPNAGYIVDILVGSGSNPNGNGFSNIQNLTGGSGADTFSFLPGGSIDGNINGGNGRDTLDYSQFNFVVTTNLETKTSTSIGGNFASLENFVGTPADTTNQVGDLPAFDTFIGLNQSSVWSITGPNSGKVNLSPPTGGVTGNVFFNFTDYENLTGGTAQDVFRFSGTGHVDGTIDGGGGIDWLDYSLIRSSVSVNLNAGRFIVPPGANVLHGINLAGGEASLTGMVTNIQNVLGSASGGDTLIGNALPNVLVGRVGNNIIMGNGGKDIIIGGKGHNLLVGGGAEDLIVAGFTSFDKNIVALDAIQTTWTTNSFSVACKAVQKGADALVVGKTVFLTLAPGPRVGRGGGFYNCTIYGGGGHNLFFVRWTSLIVDFHKGTDVTVGNP